MKRCKFHGTAFPTILTVNHGKSLGIYTFIPIGSGEGPIFPQAAKLLEPMPHSLLLQTSNQQYFALLPNIKVRLFTTQLVMNRNFPPPKKRQIDASSTVFAVNWYGQYVFCVWEEIICSTSLPSVRQSDSLENQTIFLYCR